MHVSSSSSVLISSPLQWRTPSHHVSLPLQSAVASTSTTYARDRRNAVVSIRLNPFSSSFLLQTKASPFRRRKNSKLRVVSAVFERFTERAIKAVIFSQREAKALGRDMVFTQHLLLGLIAEEEQQHRHLQRDSSRGFLGSGMTLDQARRAVRSIWRLNSQSQTASSASATELSFSISTKRVLEAALEYSRSRAHNFIAPEHILIGLLTVDDGSASQVLKRLGVNVNQLLAEAASRLQIELARDGREPSGGSQKSFPKKSTASSGKTKEKSALERFCVDLTARASEGHIDPVIGRDTEVQRIIQILCRRTKNNPILLGQSGVGKTAVVEGLATSISQADVPVYLLHLCFHRQNV